MSKLFKLKKWVTMEEAAKRLTSSLLEEVTEADILRLALDDRIQLSLMLHNGVPCLPGYKVKFSLPENMKNHSFWLDKYGKEENSNELRAFCMVENEELTIAKFRTEEGNVGGLVRLIMEDWGRWCIEDRYQKLCGFPALDRSECFGGLYVEGGNENLFWLGETEKNDTSSDRFLSIKEFPSDATLVIEVESIQKFEQSLTDDSQDATKKNDLDKPLGSRERDTLLAIIAALCEDAGFDYKKHAKTAGIIQSTADGMGVSIGETTIEGHLKKIPDALRTRMK